MNELFADFPPAFLWGAAFAVGASFGSFLNVCVGRWPKELSVVRPRSRCPRCGHEIAWYDNLPDLQLARAAREVPRLRAADLERVSVGGVRGRARLARRGGTVRADAHRAALRRLRDDPPRRDAHGCVGLRDPRRLHRVRCGVGAAHGALRLRARGPVGVRRAGRRGARRLRRRGGDRHRRLDRRDDPQEGSDGLRRRHADGDGGGAPRARAGRCSPSSWGRSSAPWSSAAS